MLIIQTTTKLGLQCFIPFYKVGNPAFTNNYWVPNWTVLYRIALRKEQIGHVCNYLKVW
jgi:hypothetical protein